MDPGSLQTDPAATVDGDEVLTPLARLEEYLEAVGLDFLPQPRTVAITPGREEACAVNGDGAVDLGLTVVRPVA